jgi:hypothetical protein
MPNSRLDELLPGAYPGTAAPLIERHGAEATVEAAKRIDGESLWFARPA